MMRAFIIVSVMLCLWGCALGPGQGFGHVGDGELHSAFDISPARALGEAAFVTNEGFEITLTEATLEVTSLRLLSVQGNVGAASFDPANPPPGYSLCHGGHCHSEDGALVPYEEIQAKLAGGSVSLVELAQLTPPRDASEVDLLSSGPTTLINRSEGDLPEGVIGRAELVLGELRLHGVVRDPKQGGVEATLSVVVPFESPVTSVLSHSVDRDSRFSLEPSITYRPSSALFDGLTLDMFMNATDQGLEISSDSSPELVSHLREQMFSIPLQIAL